METRKGRKTILTLTFVFVPLLLSGGLSVVQSPLSSKGGSVANSNSMNPAQDHLVPMDANHGGNLSTTRSLKVTMPTGDSYAVRLTRNGTVSGVVPIAPSAGAAVFVSKGDTYLIPRGEDQGRFGTQFFDLSEMIRDNLTSGLRAIVQVRSGSSPASLEQSVRSTALLVVNGSGKSLPSEVKVGALTIGQTPYVTVSAGAAYEKSLFALLNSSPEVEKVYPDSVVRPTSLPIDNGGNYLSGAVQAFQKYSTTGRGVKIAILDTGIYQSSDFKFANGTNKVVFFVNLSDDNSSTDYFGHGTHVAGIAAGTGLASGGAFVGVAPDAALFNIKVIDRFGSGFDSWIIQGIQLAVNQSANIISMSLGGPPSIPLDQAVNWAASRGVLVVVAAGNSGPGYFSIGSPGEAAGAITVGAAAEPNWYTAPPTGGVTSFSSMGPVPSNYTLKPDVTAPGWQIISDRAPGTLLDSLYPAYPGYNDSYMQLSGTSMATPFVSGALALIKQAHPGWSNNMLVASLESTASILNSTWDGVPKTNPFVEGAGLVNVSAAISPSLLFNPGKIDMGNLYARGHSANVAIRNPTSKLVRATLAVNVLDVNSATDASSFVRLNQTSITIAPFSTKTVQLTVLTGNLTSSIFSGYVEAFATGGKLLAHAALSFYALHFATATFLNAAGTPMSGAIAITGYYRFTWLEASLGQGFLTGGQASVTLPILGDKMIFMASPLSFGSAQYYVEGTADAAPANESLTIRAADALPVKLEVPGKNLSFIGTTSGLLMYAYSRQVNFPPSFSGSKVTVGILNSNSIVGGLSVNSSVFVSPNTLNDQVVLRYEYTFNGELSWNPFTGGVLTGSDLYVISADQYNLTQPFTDFVQQDGLAHVPTSILSSSVGSPLGFTYGTNVPLLSLLGYNFTFGLGSTVQTSTGRVIQVYLTPERQYWVWLLQGFFFYQASGNLFYNTFVSPPGGTTTADRYNEQPFDRPNDLVVYKYGGGQALAFYSFGDIVSAAAPLLSRHQVVLGNCSATVLVNGSQAFTGQTSGLYCGTGYGQYFSGTMKFEFLSSISYPGTPSPSVTENKTVFLTGGSGNTTSFLGGVTVSDFTPMGLALNNSVPRGTIDSQFRLTFAHKYASSIKGVSVFYSLDGGSTWSSAPVRLVSEVPATNPCRGGLMAGDCNILDQAYGNSSGIASYLYETNFSQPLAGQYVSVKVVATDSAGGVTTWSAVNELQTSSGLAAAHVLIFSEKGLSVGTRWGVQLDGPTASESLSSTSHTISFSELNGNYTYTIIPPASNATARILLLDRTGTVAVQGKDVNKTIGIYSQYLLNFRYSVIGNWTSPVDARLSLWNASQPMTVALNSTAVRLWADAGSAWNATSYLYSQSQAQRLGTNVSRGVVASSANITVPYYVQFREVASYTILDGGYPTPPLLTAVEFGAHVQTPLNSTGVYWLDQASAWAVTGTIHGSVANERWQAATPTSGTITQAGSILLTYYHQYDVSFGFSTPLGGSVGPVAVNFTATGSPMQEAIRGAGNLTWADAGSSYSYRSVIAGLSRWERFVAGSGAHGVIAGQLIISPAYFRQYYVDLRANDPSGGQFSPESGWYNATSRVTISETPATGWQFEGWTGGSGSSYSGSNASALLTMLSPANETAVFYPGLKVSDNTGGSVTLTWGSTSRVVNGSTATFFVPVNESVSLKANPSTFYVFTGWSGAISNKSASVAVVVRSPVAVTAMYGYNLPLIAGILIAFSGATAATVLLLRRRKPPAGTQSSWKASLEKAPGGS